MEKYLEIVVSSKDQAFLMASYLLAVEDEHQEKGDEARYEMSDLPSPERGRGHCFLKCKLVKLCCTGNSIPKGGGATQDSHLPLEVVERPQ
jgi:hypothetical protein